MWEKKNKHTNKQNKQTNKQKQKLSHNTKLTPGIGLCDFWGTFTPHNNSFLFFNNKWILTIKICKVPIPNIQSQHKTHTPPHTQKCNNKSKINTKISLIIIRFHFSKEDTTHAVSMSIKTSKALTCSKLLGKSFNRWRRIRTHRQEANERSSGVTFFPHSFHVQNHTLSKLT